MSVQVRSRREGAGFLSSFVGAQGELLIDTTNNRVQVHDGGTPGGWPAARLADLTGRNAVVNGNFAINQRGYASGTALAANAYAHDRWKAGSGGCTYAFAQAAPDTGVTITAGTLVQAVEAATATSCWLSWTGTATARVWQGSAAGSYAASPILVTGLTLGGVVNLEFATGTLGLVQLEPALPNAAPTRYERRHVASETVLCQRYFFAYSCAGSDYFSVIASGAAYLGYAVLLPVTMRASPTVVFTASAGGTTFASGYPYVSLATPSRVCLRGDVNAVGGYAFLTFLSANAEL